MTTPTIRKYSLCCLFLIQSIIAFGQKKVFSVPHKDTVKTIKVDLQTLIKNAPNYNGLWVETTGNILAMFEMFAVIPEEKADYIVDGIKALWLDVDEKLKINIQFLNRKNWLIRGKVNTNRRGHMNQYQGTIEQIYFLRQL